MQQEMVSKVQHDFDGQRRPVGARYVAEEQYVPVLVFLGWADRCDEEVPPPSRSNKKKKKGRR